MSNTTGELIRQMRKNKGVTLEKLAQELKVSASAVSQYERGIISPSSETLIRIARALKCQIQDITTEKDQEHLHAIFSTYPITEDGPLPPDPRTEEQKRADAKAFWDTSSGSIIKRDGTVYSFNAEISPEQKQRYADVARRAAPVVPAHAQLPGSNSDNFQRLQVCSVNLNDEGLRRLLEYAEELTQIPRYQRNPDD